MTSKPSTCMVSQYSWLYITEEVGWEDHMGISGLSWELTVTSFPDRKLFGAKFFFLFLLFIFFALLPFGLTSSWYLLWGARVFLFYFSSPPLFSLHALWTLGGFVIQD
jgi:hypothetical protein